MLNVKFSCEIKKDIFGKAEESVSDYIPSMAPKMAALGLFHWLGPGFVPE